MGLMGRNGTEWDGMGRNGTKWDEISQDRMGCGMGWDGMRDGMGWDAGWNAGWDAGWDGVGRDLFHEWFTLLISLHPYRQLPKIGE